MDFELSPELKEFQQSVRAFAEREIAPVVEESERLQRTPRDLFRKAGAAGFLGLRYPVEVGGAGAGMIAEMTLRKELSRVCAGIASALSVSSHLGSYPIFAFGNDDQISRWLKPILLGEKVTCFGLTEPGAGSDVRGIKTRATRTDKGWVLNGRKTFITNGPFCDLAIIVAYVDPEAGIDGIALFVVEQGAAGFDSSHRLEKMGHLSSEIGELILDSVEVPAENLLGPERGGFHRVMETLNGGRIVVAGGSIGVAEAALEAGVRYSGEREAFGRKIEDFQAVRHKLADAAVDLQAARLMTGWAASLYDAGKKPTWQASMAKLYASEMVLRVTDQMIRLFGGYGYIREFPIERFYRDARMFNIVEGVSDIHRNIIGGSLNG
ncbi:MAG TPA: acyl-CoA dehydrogenase family protein [Actinomycetota bacterium]|nr:acyl-CoA dehydrogenase family protein [Actinomycetota bacterium]